jgi:hypothetical protein
MARAAPGSSPSSSSPSSSSSGLVLGLSLGAMEVDALPLAVIEGPHARLLEGGGRVALARRVQILHHSHVRNHGRTAQHLHPAGW